MKQLTEAEKLAVLDEIHELLGSDTALEDLPDAVRRINRNSDHFNAIRSMGSLKFLDKWRDSKTTWNSFLNNM